MPASDKQIQDYVDSRVRPRCEQIRALLLSCEDDKSQVDDIYAALTQNPTWADNRSDAPHMLTPSDVLAWNTFVSNLITAFRADAQLPIVLKACARGLLGG